MIARHARSELQREEWETGQLMTDSSAALYRHMASAYHQEVDVTVRVVASEQISWRSKLKEALAIHTLNPTLNEDDGGY